MVKKSVTVACLDSSRTVGKRANGGSGRASKGGVNGGEGRPGLRIRPPLPWRRPLTALIGPIVGPTPPSIRYLGQLRPNDSKG